MAVDFTPWVAGVTKFKAAQMNAPLTELKESAQDECDAKAALSHEHVMADITDLTSGTAVYKGKITITDGMDLPAATEGEWYVVDDGPSYWVGGDRTTGFYANPGDIWTCTTTTVSGDYPTVKDCWHIDPSEIIMPDGDRGITFTSNSGTDLIADAGSNKIGFDDDVFVVIENGVKRTIGSVSNVVGGIGIGFEDSDKPKASGVYNAPALPYAMTVSEDFAGCHFANKENPTAEQEISILLDGTEIGTLTVATNGTPTWATTDAEDLSVSDGGRFSFGFPATQDATWAGIVITIKGIRS